MTKTAALTIDLYRHGPVDGPPALYGHTDIASTAKGQSLLRRHLSQNSEIEHLITSPLLRCRIPANTHASAAGLSIETASDLMEMNFGDWDGVPFDALFEERDKLVQFWEQPSQTPPPNGETLEAFQNRVIKGWNIIVQKSQLRHIGLVVHGGVIRMILAHILNMDFKNPDLFSRLAIDYASLNRIEISNHDGVLFPVIKFINKQAPLEDTP